MPRRIVYRDRVIRRRRRGNWVNPGTPLPVAAAQINFGGSAGGESLVTATASAQIDVAASGSGQALATGQAATELDFTAAGDVPAAGSAAIAFSASGAGARLVTARGSTTIAFGGHAKGKGAKQSPATASATIAFATDVIPIAAGVVSAALNFSPTAAGRSLSIGVGSASITIAAPGAGVSLASATGGAALVFDPEAVGIPTAIAAGGVGDSGIVFTAAAIGRALAIPIGNAAIVIDAHAASALPSGVLPGSTLLVIAAAGVPIYASRGLTQTLELAPAAIDLHRSINGALSNLAPPELQRYRSKISCRDQEAPPLEGIFRGMAVTIDCVAELGLAAGTPQRVAVEGSLRTSDDGFLFYRPRLAAIVRDFQATTDEYGALIGWDLTVEEV